ncbi:MAG TPA: tripartite tricarboxylate transporter substrate binding protein [Xanthobacteraceae bacterium]|jgi:tripartite-type tricarboxylate transporter receptor subunit TctC
MPTRRRIVALAAVSAFPALLRPAFSQNWPSRYVRLIVPLAPGGPTDIAARLVAEPMSKSWGQQVVIENKPGGGTNIGSELVARSAPDGYTILYATSSLAVAPSLYRSLGYNPVTDFAPVSHLFSFPFYMFVPNSSPAKTVREFIDYAKVHPGQLTLASPGTGSTPHLAGELFKHMAGLDMPHAPYRGASLVLNDLIPGRVDLYFASGSLLENARAGQIRVLGVTGAKRDPAAPEVPAVAEAGLPGYEVMSWQALFVPAKTPPEIIREIHDRAVAAIGDRSVRAKLAEIGYVAIGSTPEELRMLLDAEIAKWAAVVKSAGLKIN